MGEVAVVTLTTQRSPLTWGSGKALACFGAHDLDNPALEALDEDEVR